MEGNRLKTLFARYLAKDLVKDELVEFFSLVIKAKNDKFSKQLLDQLYADEHFHSLNQVIDEERVLAQILQVKSKDNLIPLAKKGRAWIKIAVAASIVISTAFFIRFYLEKRSIHQSELNATQILPAKDKASLRLSNGDVILLDTLRTGTTKLVDGVTITKSADGEVVYQAVNANNEDGINELVTPRGGKYMLVLPDRTKVWLNAATSLKYPKHFKGNERIVELQGEAYFEVARNKNKAFVVRAGAQFVEVLGTHFNFNAYPNELTTTTLLEGAVKTGNGAYSSVIKPGEKAEFAMQGEVKVSDADIESIMAWKNGDFVFKEKSLDLVMKEVARWYDVEVDFETSINPKQVKLMGWVSRSKDLSAIIKNLESATGLTFIVKERRIAVSN